MTTRYQGSTAEKRSLDTFIKLARATESFIDRTSSSMTEAGLTTSQFGVLEALYHLGPLCQKDLAAKILKSSGNMTLVIDNLEKRGLVRRERDCDDRRYYRIHLTEQGRTLIGELFPRHASTIHRAMACLTEEEQITLGRLCKKLGLNRT